MLHLVDNQLCLAPSGEGNEHSTHSYTQAGISAAILDLIKLSG